LSELRGQIYLIRLRECLTDSTLFERFHDGISEEKYIYLKFFEYCGHHTLVLEDEGREKMEWINVILATFYRELMSTSNGFFCFGGEMIEWRHINRMM
jgi:hypothetical protein